MRRSAHCLSSLPRSLIIELVEFLIRGKLDPRSKRGIAVAVAVRMRPPRFRLLYSAARLELVANRVEGAPDLVVEILSAGTARFDRGRKLQLYALYGIEEYWLVNHERRQIDFLIKEAGSFVAAPAVAGKYLSARIPEIHLDPSKLWQQVDALLLRVPRAR